MKLDAGPNSVSEHAGALLELGRAGEAVKLLESAVGKWPEVPGLWGMLSRAFLQQGDVRRGLGAAERFTELMPGAETAHRLRSLALEHLGRIEEAEAAAREAIQLAPSYWATHERLASLLGDVKGRAKDAEGAAQEALRLAPEEAGPHFRVAALAARAGRWQHAEQHLNQALAIDPHNADALHLLAVVQGRQDKHEEALGSFRALLGTDPGRVAARVEMARLVWRSATLSPAALAVVTAILVLIQPADPQRWHGLVATPAVLALLVHLPVELLRYRRKVPGYLWTVLRSQPRLMMAVGVGLGSAATLTIWWAKLVFTGNSGSDQLVGALMLASISLVAGTLGGAGVDESAVRPGRRGLRQNVSDWVGAVLLYVISGLPMGLLLGLSGGVRWPWLLCAAAIVAGSLRLFTLVKARKTTPTGDGLPIGTVERD